MGSNPRANVILSKLFEFLHRGLFICKNDDVKVGREQWMPIFSSLETVNSWQTGTKLAPLLQGCNIWVCWSKRLPRLHSKNRHAYLPRLGQCRGLDMLSPAGSHAEVGLGDSGLHGECLGHCGAPRVGRGNAGLLEWTLSEANGYKGRRLAQIPSWFPVWCFLTPTCAAVVISFTNNLSPEAALILGFQPLNL